jgi:enoyl-CoA hydratase/carnithine racemase
MSSFRFIEVESARGVQTITLNRPEKRNALSPELIDELTQVLQETSSSATAA